MITYTTFNRTIVELKPKTFLLSAISIGLLIVP